MPSPAVDDYLKTIYHHTEWQTDRITPSQLATELGLAPSSVNEMVQKLAAQGLVTHRPYGPIALSETGERRAAAIIRRHRLIETFLVQRLGYGWDEVHAEAEALEHAVSETFLDRVDADLGHPTHDPHGDPIPRADGSLPDSPGALLGTVEPGSCGIVDRVSDDDPSLLRYFDELGVALGTHLRVEQVRDYAGVIAVARRGPDGAESLVDLPAAAASAIWLAPDDD